MRYDSVIYHACKDVSSENTAENGEKEVNILHKNTPVTVYAAPVFAVNAGWHIIIPLYYTAEGRNCQPEN